MDKLKDIGRIIRGWMQSKNGLVWGVISVSVLIIASVISLIISVYTKDEPKIIPQETRGAVREGVKEGVAEPVAKIAPQIGQAIINAAYKDSPSGTDLKPTGPAGSNGAPAVDTSNWSVYRDEKLGFEIRYPEGYTTRAHNSGVSILKNEYKDSISDTPIIFVEVFKNTNLDLDAWFNSNYTRIVGEQVLSEIITADKRTQFELGDKKGFYFDWLTKGPTRSYLFTSRDKVVHVGAIGTSENSQINISEGIIKSFQ